MRAALRATGPSKDEWMQRSFPSGVDWIHCRDVHEMAEVDAEVYVDLHFSPSDDILIYRQLALHKPFLVNAIPWTSAAYGGDLIRINCWPGMLSREQLEFAFAKPEKGKLADALFREWNWTSHVVPDIAGMITPRILAMIINEAFIALESGVAGKEEIDKAMKWGTQYPWGPFEWGEKIGIASVYHLLDILSVEDERYNPSPALVAEAQKINV